jgi:hypothetical protein
MEAWLTPHPAAGEAISCRYERQRGQIQVIWAGAHLPSPSRHIYKPLTIAVAFHGLSAFDMLRQGSIKVDGTFA